MKTRPVMMLTVAALSLLLAGCSNSNKQQSTGKTTSSSASLIASKTSTKLSSDNLSPQQTVSVIASYAGNKFGGQWATVAKCAEKDGLEVDLYPTSKYQLADNGQGVAYNVKAGDQSSNLVYTVNGDNVTIYQDATSGKQARKLATVSRAQMVDYLNRNGQGGLVKSLAGSAQVNDKRAGNSTNGTTSSASTSGDVGKYGNKGPVNTPSEMQGTWYSADKNSDGPITVGKNTIQTGDTTMKLYKEGSGVDTEDQSVQDATKDWGSATFMDQDDLHWLNVRGWCQSAGDGVFYTVRTENINGQPTKVLVEAGGAGIWTDAVYYQSKSVAQQNADRKFDDLHYEDDGD